LKNLREKKEQQAIMQIQEIIIFLTDLLRAFEIPLYPFLCSIFLTWCVCVKPVEESLSYLELDRILFLSFLCDDFVNREENFLGITYNIFASDDDEKFLM
jgi:hypothetical protein